MGMIFRIATSGYSIPIIGCSVDGYRIILPSGNPHEFPVRQRPDNFTVKRRRSGAAYPQTVPCGNIHQEREIFLPGGL